MQLLIKKLKRESLNKISLRVLRSFNIFLGIYNATYIFTAKSMYRAMHTLRKKPEKIPDSHLTFG